jgi:hypothetical protein
MGSLSLALLFLSLPVWAGPNEITAHRQYERLSEKAPEPNRALLAAERKAIFERVSNHPVTDLDNLPQYDPQGFIGFCFGRAMAVHLGARQAGLERGSVHKLFIVGDLRSGPDPEWRFHVTTVVKGQEDDRWYAIDPIMTPPIAPGGPLLLEEWVRIVRGVWDKKGLAKLYFTSADTIMPDVTRDPNGTTGDAILEVAFRPETKPGFEKRLFGAVETWATTAAAEAAYLMSVQEPESDRFKFDGLEIGGEAITYADYFVKLLGDLSGDTPIPGSGTPKVRAVPSAVVGVPVRANLHSPRFDRFFPKPGGVQ